jgi:uncharacterized membrane protein YqgA involved in biofilm formation
MNMYSGVIVNVLAVIIGSLIGLFFKNKLKQRIHTALINVIALGVIGIGFTYAIQTQNLLVLMICLIIGTLLGTILKLDDRLDSLGSKIQNRLKSAGDTFSEGFAGASILFCVGSMAIMGCMDSGLNASNGILYTKSLMDGVTSIFLASAMGIGVLFSAASVLLYEGLLTLVFSLFAGSLDTAVISEISAVGGIILIGIAINLLGLKKIKTADMTISLFLPIVIVPLLALVS